MTTMALGFDIKVLEECRIHPLSTPFTGCKTTLLSFFDLPFVSWFYYKPVFFYKFHHPKAHFVQTVIPKIKFSLSVALQHFYPLAGHLFWPQDANKPEIVCKDDDSISLLVTESSSDFDHLSGNNTKDVNEFDTLVPKFTRSTSTTDRLIPLLALHVTLFPDKGISIGFNFHHAAVDGRTAAYFIRSWASICKDGLVADDLLPCLDRTIVKDPKGLELKYVNGGIEESIIKREEMNVSNIPIRTATLVDILLATFVLGSSDIKRLKELVKTHLKLENHTEFHLSTFVVSSAFFWVCSVKARWGENSVSEEMEYFIPPVDCSWRLDPPLPASYLGNCLGTIAVLAKRSDLLGKDGIAFAAKLIGNEVHRIKKSVWNALEKGTFYIKTLPRDSLLIPGGSPKFGMYQTDFGWGKPKKVEQNSVEHTGALSLIECPNEEGAIEVGVVRNKVEMDAFASVFKRTLKALP